MGIYINTSSLILLFVISVSPVTAGTLYKCVDAKGISSYQQTACLGKSKVAKVITYTPVANNASSSWSSQNNRTYSNTRDQQVQYRSSNPNNQDSSDRIRRTEQAASTFRGSPTPTATASDIGSVNSYLDTRSSTMINGQIKVAPNQVWDPATNVYHNLNGNGEIVY